MMVHAMPQQSYLTLTATRSMLPVAILMSAGPRMLTLHLTSIAYSAQPSSMYADQQDRSLVIAELRAKQFDGEAYLCRRALCTLHDSPRNRC